MKSNPNIEMVEQIARGLGPLLEKVAFIGGATTSLYLNKNLDLIRPTKDVDCVVAITTYLEQQQLERQLEALGFQHCMDRGAPICRWVFQTIRADIMPSHSSVLGFTNHWFEAGMKNSIKQLLPSGLEISIFSIPYFLAAKMDAFKDRGKCDFYASADWEDIITVMDGRKEIRREIFQATNDVKEYLKKEIQEFSKSEFFHQSISGNLAPGPGLEERASRVLDILLNIP